MTMNPQAHTAAYLAQEISDEVKTIISDLDLYMTPYEKGEYLRSFLGDDTKAQYLTLTKPWRALWDGFYSAEEFTRAFVDMYIELIKTDHLKDKLSCDIYWKLKIKIGQLEDDAWTKRNEAFRAKQREAKYFYTGKL